MPNKRYQCRSHDGGIFSMPPRRGRPPVRCTGEFPCDRAKTITVAGKAVTVSKTIATQAGESGRFEAMTNAELKAYAREHFSTISKITSREQLIAAMTAQLAKRAQVTNVVREVPGIGKVAVITRTPAESVLKPRTGANDSLPLAMRAKAQLEPVGWVVKGRAWLEGASVVTHHAEVVASRGAETLIMHWVDGVLAEQQYSMEHLKQAENGMPASKLSFNPDEMTDGELVRMLRGMKVTWWNTLGSSTETAIIGPANIAIEHLFVGGGDTDNSKRIIKFLDHSGGGFRAFHVGALLKVG